MDDKIIELAKQLNDLYELSYNQIKHDIEWIIKSKNTNLKLIENYLERLLNISTDKSYQLLKKLCDYCSNFNKEISNFYLNEFEEIYGEEEPKTLKKDYKR